MEDEFQLIAKLLQHRPPINEEVEVDVGDDAAVYRPSKEMSQVITCDTMVEGVHFIEQTMDPVDTGWKGIASNVSDIIAMGGIPKHAVISLAVPQDWTEKKLIRLYQGLGEATQHYGVTILGGDTVRSMKGLMVSITLVGEVEQGTSLRRSSARPGDILFVTGFIGASAAGLHILLREDAKEWRARFPSLIQAHQRPCPQIEAGRLIHRLGERAAANDVSDGLGREAREIAEASGVRLVIDRDQVPLSKDTVTYGAECGVDPFQWAFDGGEDYQLLATCPAQEWKDFQGCALAKGMTFTQIGWVEDGEAGVDCIIEGHRSPLTYTGYNHFA
ncbi:thiamine-phosphate kinase [Marininema halotolerans]|uniref:Thiamine-monophosphate kinase n=1 Tax=Marininema halotolerans TaxID=1155944 RepID=A0A1I6TMY2_9BACL|nr:thiamine-phosphate kinase [Marininema halotolerans]SFS90347.1 thiamine-monophosphate kinase [Marininema halotolerans]